MMKKLLLSSLFMIFGFGADIPKNHIVSTNWLEKNQDNKNIVVIDARSEAEYKKGHIKNAYNYSKDDWQRGTTVKIPKLYNTPEQIEDMMSKAGITKDSIVVFYSSCNTESDYEFAAIGVWSLYIYGFNNSVILNGGFEKWISEKKEITQDIPNAKNSNFKISKFVNEVATINDVVEAIYDENIQLADARDSKFYLGEDDREDLVRHGRIPTAKLTPMMRQVKKENNYYIFIDEKDSRKLLNNAGFGIELDKPSIIYCNTGAKAKGLWFATKFIANIENIKVYDGSMVEYSRTNFPMESGQEF
ncbi:sulfurtransferase [Arcobacter lanthieri]|uniref:sulfurtransferase n=1 Tax=Aliarcobacter lanthieri TaxID=1355374 RepID=UPI001921D91D|nr:rhodanese-like domain-containing protein [Aliarcobacter lanthieri]MBL3520364.1 sulfurtransferase [Aliarcobacter lanthieri]